MNIARSTSLSCYFSKRNSVVVIKWTTKQEIFVNWNRKLRTPNISWIQEARLTWKEESEQIKESKPRNWKQANKCLENNKIKQRNSKKKNAEPFDTNGTIKVEVQIPHSPCILHLHLHLWLDVVVKLHYYNVNFKIGRRLEIGHYRQIDVHQPDTVLMSRSNGCIFPVQTNGPKAKWATAIKRPYQMHSRTLVIFMCVIALYPCVIWQTRKIRKKIKQRPSQIHGKFVDDSKITC